MIGIFLVVIILGLAAGNLIERFRFRGWKQALEEQKREVFHSIVAQVFGEAKLIVDTSDITVTIKEIENEIFLRKKEWAEEQIKML